MGCRSLQRACAACPDQPDRLTTTISHHHLHACSLASTESVWARQAVPARLRRKRFVPSPSPCMSAPAAGEPREALECLARPAVDFVLPVLPACLAPAEGTFCAPRSPWTLP